MKKDFTCQKNAYFFGLVLQTHVPHSSVVLLKALFFSKLFLLCPQRTIFFFSCSTIRLCPFCFICSLNGLSLKIPDFLLFPPCLTVFFQQFFFTFGNGLRCSGWWKIDIFQVVGLELLSGAAGDKQLLQLWPAIDPVLQLCFQWLNVAGQ